MQQNEIYQAVTDQIIKQIESGTPPWRQPWISQGQGLPMNCASNRKYKGTNVWLLSSASQAKGYESNLWATFRQWQKLGGFVRRGQKATKILYWNVVKKTVIENGEEKEEEHYYANTFSVFNLNQCGGEALDHLHQQSLPQREFDDFEPAERLIEATGADIRFGGSRAYYTPADDYIQLPQKSAFKSESEFYSTTLHELAHWSGHESRLDRSDKLGKRFGSEDYAMEELIAEMASAFLCSSLGIENTAGGAQNASYLASWVEVLNSDSRAIITASSSAAAASDYILACGQESVEETSDELVAV